MSSHCNVNTITYEYEAGASPIENWYHWVVTTDSNGTKMFINGEEKEVNQNFADNTSVEETFLIIGACVDTGGGDVYSDGSVIYWKGRLDNIRFYDRSLSNVEINDLYLYEKSYVFGDLDRDGQINPKDALCILQAYVMLCPTDCGPCEGLTCDVDKDGSITPADALCILRRFVGMPSCLD